MPGLNMISGWTALVLYAVLPGVSLPIFAATSDLSLSPPAQEAENAELLQASVQGAVQTDERDFTLRRLEKIQAETVIVEAQVARAKALRSLEESGSSARLPDISDGMAAVAINLSQTPRPARGLPQISEIYGTGSRLTARLLLTDGSHAEFTTGQHIPGTQLKVTRISAREVQVATVDGSSVQTLNFTGGP